MTGSVSHPPLTAAPPVVAAASDAPQTSWARVHAFIVGIVEAPLFDATVTLIIVANALLLSAYDPFDAGHQKLRNRALKSTAIGFNALLTVEMLMRMLASGLRGKRSYFTQGWNWLSCALVLLGWLTALVPNMVNLTGLRFLYLLRPLSTNLRGFAIMMDTIVESLRGLADVLVLLLLTNITFALLGMEMWRTVLSGQCAYLDPGTNGLVIADPPISCAIPCSQASDDIVCTPAFGDACPALMPGPLTPFSAGTCVSGPNPDWGQTSFDNMFAAMLATYTFITTEGWTGTMYTTWHTWGQRWLVGLLFTIHVYVGAFVIMEIAASELAEQYVGRLVARRDRDAEEEKRKAALVAIFVDNRRASLRSLAASTTAAAGGDQETTTRLVRAGSVSAPDAGAAQAAGVQSRMNVLYQGPQPARSPVTTLSPPVHMWPQLFVLRLWARWVEWYKRVPPLPAAVRARFHSIVDHPLFQAVVMVLVVANGVVLGMGYDSMSAQYARGLEIANYFFVAAFTVELALRVLAVGPAVFLGKSGNLFDTAIVLASLVDVGIQTALPHVRNTAQMALQTTRVFRVLRVTALWDGLRDVASDVAKAAPHAMYALLLLSIITLSFAVIGLHVFGGPGYQAAVEAGVLESVPRMNFNSLWLGFVTTFQVMDNENWNDTLHTHMAAFNPASALFFLVLILIGNVLFLNLFLAVLVYNFENRAASRKDKSARHHARKRRSVAANAHKYILKPLMDRAQRAWQLALTRMRASQPRGDEDKAGIIFENPCVTVTSSGRSHRVPPLVGLEMKQVGAIPNPVHLRSTPRSTSSESAKSSTQTPSALRVTSRKSISTPRDNSLMSRLTHGMAQYFRPKAQEHDDNVPERLVSLHEAGVGGAEVTMRHQGGSAHPTAIIATVVSPTQGQDQVGKVNATDEVTDRSVSGASTLSSAVTADLGVAAGLQMDDAAATPALRIVVKRLGEVSVTPMSVVEEAVEDDDDDEELSSRLESARVAAEFTDRPSARPLKASAPDTPSSHASMPMGGRAAQRRRTVFRSMSNGRRAKSIAGPDTPLSRRPTVAVIDVKETREPATSCDNRFCRGWDKFRWLADAIVSNYWVDKALLLLILISSINLALEQPYVAVCANLPSSDPSNCSMLSTYLKRSEYAINGVFAVEMLLKVVAQGAAFFRQGWNVVDFGVVVVSIISLFPSSSSRLLQGLRAIRAVRPLRLVAHFASLRLVLNALLVSLPRMRNVLVMIFLVAYIFAVVGNLNFMGIMSYCNDPEIVTDFYSRCNGMFNVTGALCSYLPTDALTATCLTSPSGVPFPRIITTRAQNFDNIARAMLTVFELTSGENWPVFMTYAMDGAGYHLPQQRDVNQSAAAYYLLIELVMNMFMIELSVGIIVDTYNALRDESSGTQLLTESQKVWVHNMRVLLTLKPPHVPKAPALSGGALWVMVRQACFKVVQHPAFEPSVMAVICVNIFSVASRHVGQTNRWTTAQLVLTSITTALFILEMSVRVLGYGLRQFSRSPLHWFDTLTVVCSICSLGVTTGSAGSVLRFVRTLRLLRIVRFSTRLMRLLRMLLLCIPAFVNILSILALNFFIFAIVGMNMLSGVRYANAVALSADANFDSFSTSLMTLIRAATGENFNMMLHDLEVQEPYCVPRGPGANCGPNNFLVSAYWVLFFTISTFILLNMITAVLLEAQAFISDAGTGVHAGTYRMSHGMSEQYATLWAKHDRAQKLTLPMRSVVEILAELQEPLGVRGSKALQRRVKNMHDIASANTAMLRRRPTVSGIMHGEGMRPSRKAQSIADISRVAARMEAELHLRKLNVVPDANGLFHFHALLGALIGAASHRPALGAREAAIQMAAVIRERDAHSATSYGLPTGAATMSETAAAMEVVAAWRRHVFNKKVRAREEAARSGSPAQQMDVHAHAVAVTQQSAWRVNSVARVVPTPVRVRGHDRDVESATESSATTAAAGTGVV